MNDMNELTNKLQQVMVPKAALIAYEYRENRYGNGMHYLELHPINDRGRMEAAMPVTSAVRLVECFSIPASTLGKGAASSATISSAPSGGWGWMSGAGNVRPWAAAIVAKTSAA